mmetsp:Transcript_90994/g.161152  ORF Transcript_90994/g.161152 Transcript_90994/m.161152 type:complete len:296 (-) Transcript_90994:63-950(-)
MADKKEAPSWATIGARCEWISKSSINPLPVTVSSIDAKTGALTVTFDKDPKAFKIVPLSQLGRHGPLRPRNQGTKRTSPLEESASQVRQGLEWKRRKEAEEKERIKKEKEEQERRELQQEQERKRKQAEKELEFEMAERARLQKLEELRRWREQEEEEKIRKAEEEKKRIAEEKRRAEEKKRRKKEREELRREEERREQEEQDAWAKFKEEARLAEQQCSAPSWAGLGAKCIWISASSNQSMSVTVTAVDTTNGTVTVTFDKDPSAFKIVPVALCGENGPLQPKFATKAVPQAVS